MAANIISLDMRIRVNIYCLALLCACASACYPLSPEVGDGARVELALGQNPGTRAHFEDNAGTASFVWDVGSDMIAVVSHAGALVEWTGGEQWSPMNISYIAPGDKSKVLKASSALTLAPGAAAKDDPLYFLSPVNGSPLCSLSSSASEVRVEFGMPSTFSQSASSRLEEFEPYSFIRGESTILSAPSGADRNFAASSTTFRAIPATFRFKVTNNSSSDIVLESVKISCDKLFPDRLEWTVNQDGVKLEEPDDKSGYFSTIKTSIASGFGELITAGEGSANHTGTYYAMCLPFDDEASMSGATLAFILETGDKIHTFNVPASEFFSGSRVKRFESNKVYSFNFSLSDESVELEGVTISDWVNEPFRLPTEEVSAFVLLNPSYWVQDRENLYTYGFSKILDSTLWGECNAGEYLYFATDFKLNWYKASPSGKSDTDYLSDYFGGISDFKWETPSRADYEALFNEANTDIEMCRDGDSGIFGLKISRKDDAGISIFLPCTEKTETKTEYPEGGYTRIERTLQGYYWTVEYASEEQAWLLHFKFSQTEKLVGENSTDISFSKPEDFGGKLYEFTEALKTNSHTVRPILRNND